LLLLATEELVVLAGLDELLEELEVALAGLDELLAATVAIIKVRNEIFFIVYEITR